MKNVDSIERIIASMNKYQRFRLKVDDIINKEEDESSNLFDYFIVTLILANVVAIVLESFNGFKEAHKVVFRVFENITGTAFAIEYILRLWTADVRFPSKNKIRSILKFIISPMAVIDLLAILTLYLPMFFAKDFVLLRLLRLTRLLRVFKLGRYTRTMKIVGKVIRDKKDELAVTIFITFILLLIASTLMYNIEHEINPNQEAFANIISSFWWAIATLTTIGYGDVYPVTGWGKFLSAIIAMLGIGLVALPTGIISSSFMEELSKHNKKEEDAEEGYIYCPHCGKKLKD